MRRPRTAVVIGAVLLVAIAGCANSTGAFTAGTACSEYNQGLADPTKRPARQAWDDEVATRYGNFAGNTVANIAQYCQQKPSAALDEATRAAVRGVGKSYNGMD